MGHTDATLTTEPMGRRRRVRALVGWLVAALVIGTLAAGGLLLGAGLAVKAVLGPFFGGGPTCSDVQLGQDGATVDWLRAALATEPDVHVQPGCQRPGRLPDGSAGGDAWGSPGASAQVPAARRTAVDAALAAHGCVLNPIDPVSRLAKDVCTIHVNDVAYSLTRRADPQGSTVVSITPLSSFAR